MKHLFTCVLLAGAFLGYSLYAEQRAATAMTRQRAGDGVSDTTYNQVLDILFPRDVLEPGAEFAFVLRYEPAFDVETQIVLVKRAGLVQVLEYRPVKGRIETQLNEILRRTRRENAREMARQIRIRRQVVSAGPNDVKEWREGFYDKVCPAIAAEKLFNEKGEASLIADGTRYRLWYKGLGSIHYDFIGSGVNSPTGSEEQPFITWMKDIRQLVEKLQATPSVGYKRRRD